MDETKKILYTEFIYKETPVKILAFASKKEDLLYYEITAENTCLNLTAKVKPRRRRLTGIIIWAGFILRRSENEPS